MSEVYPPRTGATSRMYGIPSSSLRVVGKNLNGLRMPLSVVRSPNHANGVWNQSSTPLSRSQLPDPPGCLALGYPGTQRGTDLADAPVGELLDLAETLEIGGGDRRPDGLGRLHHRRL